jgi:quercetin dioxygenase-like cupin family protein
MTTSQRPARPGALLCLALLGALAVRADTPAEGLEVALPQALDWASVPQLPPEIRVARLIGSTAAPGPYALRVRFPAGSRNLPHTHPDARLVTVISGEYFLGVGSLVDPHALRRLPAGSVVLIPAGLAHYSVAGDGEVVLQESGVGPSGVSYVGPAGESGPKAH